MKKLFTLACVALSSSFAYSQSAEEIVDTYFENIGGKENFEQIKAIQMDAKVAVNGLNIPMTMINTESGKQILVAKFQGQEIVQLAFDGKTAWSTNFQTMQAEKAESDATENVKRSIVDFPDPLLNYKKKGYTIEKLGTESIEGTECVKLKLTKKPQLADGVEVPNIVYYYFETENYVPILTETEVMTGPQKGVISVTSFSDYQEVEGLYFPFSMTQGAKGQPGGQTIQFESITINPEVDESQFQYVEPEVKSVESKEGE